jgi:hypothetical protein
MQNTVSIQSRSHRCWVGGERYPFAGLDKDHPQLTDAPILRSANWWCPFLWCRRLACRVAAETAAPQMRQKLPPPAISQSGSRGEDVGR